MGLSRAILCNDGLVKKLEELERNAAMYNGLVIHVKKLLRAIYDLSRVKNVGLVALWSRTKFYKL